MKTFTHVIKKVMSQVPISESEAKVMQVLWDEHPLGADQIIERLSGETWQAATVKTLINRLLNKGAIAADAEGRRYLYRPLLSRQAYVNEASSSLVDRLFGGKVAPLVSHFAEQRKLTKRDVAELRRLLDELDHE
jgi:BlaI family transcriptional regulator, penicillinase repressor